jgi:hypothetical protein
MLRSPIVAKKMVVAMSARRHQMLVSPTYGIVVVSQAGAALPADPIRLVSFRNALLCLFACNSVSRDYAVIIASQSGAVSPADWIGLVSVCWILFAFFLASMVTSYAIAIASQREAAGPADPVRPIGFWHVLRLLAHHSPRLSDSLFLIR